MNSLSLNFSTKFTIGLLLFPTLNFAAELSPKEIMAKNEQARKIGEVTSTCKLTQSSNGKENKLKTFRWWRKLAGNGMDYRTLVRFTSPSTIKGEGILILENDKSDNEVLLYLPAFKKIRRVENQQQTGKFMGSEFTYSDIATPHLEDYTYSGGKKEPCPDAGAPPKGDLDLCYVVEAKPSSERIKERTGYTRTKNWVRADNFMVAQVEYHDLQDTLFKRLKASDFKKVDASRDKWLAHRTEMSQLKTGNSSLIQFEEVKVNSGIAEATFTQQNLSRAE